MLGYLVAQCLFYIFVKHSRGLRLVSMYTKAGAIGDSKVFFPFFRLLQPSQQEISLTNESELRNITSIRAMTHKRNVPV